MLNKIGLLFQVTGSLIVFFFLVFLLIFYLPLKILAGPVAYIKSKSV